MVLLSFILIFSITILLYEFNASKVIAKSPSFVREEISDNPYHDTVFVDNFQSYYRYSLSHIDTKELVDLRSATYFSDGNTLNSTLWLTKEWIDNFPSDHTILFGILIDVDNNRHTGLDYLPDRGFEYVVQLNLNNGTWSKEIDEFTSAGEIRNLVLENYPEDPLESNQTSIPLSLDLSMLNYPAAYGLEFFVTDQSIDNQGRQYTDTLGPIHVKDHGTPLTSASSSQEINDPNQDGIQIDLRKYSHINKSRELADFPITVTPVAVATNSHNTSDNQSQEVSPPNFTSATTTTTTFESMEKLTVGGTYKINMSYNPVTIGSENSTTFNIEFLDPKTGKKTADNVQYDFMIMPAEDPETMITYRASNTAQKGSAQQSFIFKDENNSSIIVRVSNIKTEFPLDELVDIENVRYITDRNVLSATLWLGKDVPSILWLNSDASILLYGILINADANEKTGVDGVDYQLEIQWNNNTDTWTKFLAEYSSEGHTKYLEIEENFKEDNLFDPTSSSDPNALLSLDLDTITLEDKYEVLSYAEVIYGKPESLVTIDLTGWTGIQSTPSYYVYTSEDPLFVRKGSQKEIGLQLRTTSGLIANVTEFSPSQNPNVVVTFNPENQNKSYGSENLAHFDIKVSDSALVGEYTIPIIANISEKLVQPSTLFRLNYTDLLLPTLGYKIASANLTVKVLDRESIPEQFKNFWDVFGDPISLIGGGFAAGFSALVFDRINKKRKEKNNQETLDKY